jgi:hypothetical protein
MTQFHEGQDVEVWKEVRTRGTDLHQNYVRRWCKAKIVYALKETPRYLVQFPEPNGKYDVDGTRAVFDAEHIRAVERDIGLPDYALDDRQWCDRWNRRIGETT